MVTDRNANNLPKSQELSSFSGMASRVYWMLLGHPVIATSAYYIATGKSPIISNTVYFLLVMSVILVRYSDIKFFHGQTAEGEPATMKHWKRFTFIVLGYSSALYMLAFMVARFRLL